MVEDFEPRKENLEKELTILLDELKSKTTPSKMTQIYEDLISSLKEDLEKINQPNNKCKSCGEPLEDWEQKICGPCKIADVRYEEEEE